MERDIAGNDGTAIPKSTTYVYFILPDRARIPPMKYRNYLRLEPLKRKAFDEKSTTYGGYCSESRNLNGICAWMAVYF